MGDNSPNIRAVTFDKKKKKKSGKKHRYSVEDEDEERKKTIALAAEYYEGERYREGFQPFITGDFDKTLSTVDYDKVDKDYLLGISPQRNKDKMKILKELERMCLRSMVDAASTDKSGERECTFYIPHTHPEFGPIEPSFYAEPLSKLISERKGIVASVESHHDTICLRVSWH